MPRSHYYQLHFVVVLDTGYFKYAGVIISL